MKKIVYKTETGIAVIHPTESFYRQFFPILKRMKENEGKTDQEIDDILYIMTAQKDVPEGAEYKIVEEAEIPVDRTFRDAWGYDLKPELEKSKEIWKDKLRADRAPLLAELDVEYQRADEDKDDVKKADIVKEKKRLRDITSLVDSVTDVESLKSITL